MSCTNLTGDTLLAIQHNAALARFHMTIVDYMTGRGFNDYIALCNYGSHAVTNAQVLATSQVDILIADNVHIVVQGACISHQVHVAIADEDALGIIEVLGIGIETGNDGIDFIIHRSLVCTQIIVACLTIQQLEVIVVGGIAMERVQRYSTLILSSTLGYNVATVHNITCVISLYQATIFVTNNLSDELLIISIIALKIEYLCLELSGRARRHDFTFIGLGQLNPSTGAVLVVLLGDEYAVPGIVEISNCISLFRRSVRIDFSH